MAAWKPTTQFQTITFTTSDQAEADAMLQFSRHQIQESHMVIKQRANLFNAISNIVHDQIQNS